MKKTILAVAILSFSSVFASNAIAEVVTTIKPLDFIASAISKGVTNTTYIVTGNQSPHTYNLKPQDLYKIKTSDLFIYVSNNMEINIGRSLRNSNFLPKNVLVLGNLPGIKNNLVQSFDNDEIESSNDDDNQYLNNNEDSTINSLYGDGTNNRLVQLETNYHIWLSPTFAKIIATNIANRLQAIYPHKKTQIQQNLTNFNANLNKTIIQIKKMLNPKLMQNYIVYHEAYTYFEKDFGFRQHDKGALYINVSVPPSIKTLDQLHALGRRDNIKVIFSEPQFNKDIAIKMANSMHAKIGYLDPLGTNIPVGNNSYDKFLLSIAQQFQIAMKK